MTSYRLTTPVTLGQGTVTPPTLTTLLNINNTDTTSGTNWLCLSGADFGEFTTSNEGIAFLNYDNTSGDRILWIGDSEFVTTGSGGQILQVEFNKSSETVTLSTNTLAGASSANLSITTINNLSILSDVTITINAPTVTITATTLSIGTVTSGVWHGSNIDLSHGGTNASLTATNGGIVYSTATAMAISAAGTSGQLLQSNGAAAPTWVTLSSIGVTSITGTVNEITASSSTGAVTLSISSGYVGQTSITTLGTITTGTWTGTNIALANGGTNASLTATNGGVVYSTASAMAISAAGTSGQLLQSNGAAAPTWVTLSSIGVTSITGTTNEITASSSTGAVTLSISSGYVGQTSITTLGTITTGTWTGTNIALANGGTNASLTATNGGVVYSTASAFAISAAGTSGQLLQSNGAAAPTWVTLSSIGVTSITGTTNQITASSSTGAVTLSIATGYVGQTSITTLGTIGTGTWQGSLIQPTYGGTGVNNGSNTLTVTANSDINQDVRTTASPLFAKETISPGGAVTAPTPTTILNVNNNTAGNAGIVLSGKDYTNANTSNDGITMTLGQNTTGSRCLWIGDSANFTSSSNNMVLQINPSFTNTAVYIDALDTTTGGQVLYLNSNGGSVFIGSTFYPKTVSGGQLLYASSNNHVAGLTSANDGVLVTSNTGVPSILAGSGTANQVLMTNTSAAPSWSTATYPSTITINELLYSSASNTVTGLATVDSAVLTTSSGGVPTWSTGLAVSLGGTVGRTAVQECMGLMISNITNGATLTQAENSGAGTSNYRGFSFSGATVTNYTSFRFPLPLNWSGAGGGTYTFTFVIAWTSPTTGSSSTVVWSVKSLVRKTTDTFALAFGSAVTVNSNGPGTANNTIITAESSAMTPGSNGSISASTIYELEVNISRTSQTGSDTFTGNAIMTSFLLYYTTNSNSP